MSTTGGPATGAPATGGPASDHAASTGAGSFVVLGVCGGIAAYKAVDVCRRLTDAGVHVAPVLTADAARFVGEVTFSALASEPVQRSLWDEAHPIPHTRLGQAADLVVVAPATARLIGSYAAGISDDLLTATLLATRAPVLLCPAMHTEMWEHPAVQENLDVLVRRGVLVVPPEEGALAGGDEGAGRLAAPEVVVARALSLLGPRDLAGVRLLVTAGGTREPLDAVRVITNRSSGKQGYALAEEAVARGGEVTLVTASERPPPPGCAAVVPVGTAAELRDAVLGCAEGVDVVVMAAAVADFRPKGPAAGKLKKDDGPPTLELEPTADILAELGERRSRAAGGDGPLLVGFAAETSDVIANARAKLERKRLDLIVANDVGDAAAGFDHDTNAVTVLAASGEVATVAHAPKREVARAVLDAVVARLVARR